MMTIFSLTIAGQMLVAKTGWQIRDKRLVFGQYRPEYFVPPHSAVRFYVSHLLYQVSSSLDHQIQISSKPIHKLLYTMLSGICVEIRCKEGL